VAHFPGLPGFTPYFSTLPEGCLRVVLAKVALSSARWGRLFNPWELSDGWPIR
jgi:hypothetical protein